ncbi:10838_t:CDS:2, partial [Gigaspora rosea]
AGLRERQFQSIAKTAINIWKDEGHDKYECAILVAHMRQFKEKKNGFDLPYSFEANTPLLWWMTNFTELAFYGKALPVNNLQELVATSTFLTEFDDDDPIEHSETETEIEQNLESINFLNIESMVNLNHNAFQDDESDSESEGSQISSNEENYEYDDEPMISNNEGQGVFDFDPTDLVTDLVNVWENSDTENIEDMLNMEMCMDDNLDDILDEDGERDIDSDPEANSENLPIALRKARREFCR